MTFNKTVERIFNGGSRLIREFLTIFVVRFRIV